MKRSFLIFFCLIFMFAGCAEIPSSKENKETSLLNDIFEETNKRRAEEGLPPLERNSKIDPLAYLRATESEEKWSHKRPDGRDFYTVFENSDIKIEYAGENLLSTKKTKTAKDVLDEWMKSPGHRKNIMDEKFTSLGLAFYEGKEYDFYVQLFIK